MNSPLTPTLLFKISSFTLLSVSYWSCLFDSAWFLIILMTTLNSLSQKMSVFYLPERKRKPLKLRAAVWFPESPVVELLWNCCYTRQYLRHFLRSHVSWNTSHKYNPMRYRLIVHTMVTSEFTLPAHTHTHPHTHTHTHTHPVRILWTNDQMIAQSATYTTHNTTKHNTPLPTQHNTTQHTATYTEHNTTQQTNIHALSKFRICDCRNQMAATYALHHMTTGIGLYIFREYKIFLHL